MLSSFGFRYTEPADELLRIYTIGYQKIAGAGYDFHGLNRAGNRGMLFQYSLSGAGYLEMEGKVRAVPKGHAFLVEIPGNHRYYYEPAGGKPWEVLWIRFDGRPAETYWDQLRERGRIHPFAKESTAIRLLLKLYGDAKGARLNGPVDQSVRIYEWLVHVWDYVVRGGQPDSSVDAELFPRAVQFMKDNLRKPIALQDIADSEQLSKYHFCKQFRLKLGMSPIAYLNKLRIEQAVSLLSTTSLSVADIAGMTGFDTPGYFTKVFRRIVGGTPTEYRDSKHEPAATVMRIY